MNLLRWEIYTCRCLAWRSILHRFGLRVGHTTSAAAYRKNYNFRLRAHTVHPSLPFDFGVLYIHPADFLASTKLKQKPYVARAGEASHAACKGEFRLQYSTKALHLTAEVSFYTVLYKNPYSTIRLDLISQFLPPVLYNSSTAVDYYTSTRYTT